MEEGGGGFTRGRGGFARGGFSRGGYTRGGSSFRGGGYRGMFGIGSNHLNAAQPSSTSTPNSTNQSADNSAWNSNSPLVANPVQNTSKTPSWLSGSFSSASNSAAVQNTATLRHHQQQQQQSLSSAAPPQNSPRASPPHSSPIPIGSPRTQVADIGNVGENDMQRGLSDGRIQSSPRYGASAAQQSSEGWVEQLILALKTAAAGNGSSVTGGAAVMLEACEFSRTMDVVNLRGAERGNKELEKLSTELIESLKRERALYQELSVSQLELRRRTNDCELVQGKLDRLDQNVAFIERDWTDLISEDNTTEQDIISKPINTPVDHSKLTHEHEPVSTPQSPSHKRSKVEGDESN
mmetsp:Transcript_7989/g.14491  ORF Transcript_7989/g.14491 Transcript_7989/m.14491 type:complete len:351 (-) Transcript_7989:1219-2271(-)|eukprot:CAMPEP_0182441998 /NCGR_PEP_ID=MMETSP1172-20130603/979_1 /TAXON_ID=708627 /ORGANISM="Timspurckia oligopyrenoides, Strain CCMP3278" /LENGTH=350 /DNA_ID=CAMNT_0024636647 /DNA_START=44 /DNA_END=1096 /DNA_ORIENTATION=-